MTFAHTYRAAQFGVVEVEDLVEVGDVAVERRQRQLQLHHTVLPGEELLRGAAFVVVRHHVQTPVKVAVVAQGKVGGDATRGGDH